MAITIRWARVLDMVERTAATYLQAFCGLLLADSTNLLDLGSVRAAAVAALPAALAAIKAAFALGLGSSGTASLLPARKAVAAPGEGTEGAPPGGAA
jgi:hypothetical protein